MFEGASLGVQLSGIIPNDDLGKSYRSGQSIDVFYTNQDEDAKWKIRTSFSYARLNNISDTIKELRSSYSGGPLDTLMQVDRSLNMKLFSIDYERLLVSNKHLGLYLGLGLAIGTSRYSYGKITDNWAGGDDMQNLLCGIKVGMTLNYRISNRFDVFANGGKAFLLCTQPPGYVFDKVGAGISWYIAKREPWVRSKSKTNSKIKRKPVRDSK